VLEKLLDRFDELEVHGFVVRETMVLPRPLKRAQFEIAADAHSRHNLATALPATPDADSLTRRYFTRELRGFAAKTAQQ
jgi:hypothetical protein